MRLRWLRNAILASAALGSLAVVSVLAANGPRIVFDATSHDFGDLAGDAKVEHRWTFRNEGDETLEIVNTKTSCGCTMSFGKGTRVEPGETGELLVAFDAAGQSGRLRKTLAVMTNDPQSPIVRLTVRAVVTPLEFEAVEGGHPPILGQSLLMGDCAGCHAAPASGKSGRELWDGVCAMCHGPDARGARGPSLRARSFLETRTDEELTQGIAYGTANPRMPGFARLMGGPLDDAQVASLVSLLREWGPDPDEGEPPRP